MKLSILIPFHSGTGFLRDCLNSIAAQSYEQLEVILVCDHVPQEEQAELEKLLDECKQGLHLRRFKLAREHSGVAAARNRALDEAYGEYVLFVDSDDYLDTGYIQTLLAEAAAGTVVLGAFKKYWYGRTTYIKECEEKKQKAEAALDGIQSPVRENDSSESTESGEESIRLASALNILIPRIALEDGHIYFDEELKYYSDFPFVCALTKRFEIKRCREAVYIKRSHNDSITQPALSQIKDDGKPGEFLRSYRLASDALVGEKKQFAQEHLCDYIIKEFIRSKGLRGFQWNTETLKNYSEALLEFELKSYAWLTKQEYKFLKRLRKGKTKSALRQAKLLLLWRRKRGKLGSRQQWGRAFSKFIFRRMPVKKNWVMFESFLGKNYADSCKYIYEHMQREKGNEYRYIWFIDNKELKKAPKAYAHSLVGKSEKKPGRVKVVKPYSLKYFYYISRAKYWVNNMRQPAWFIKRPGMVFLETWHGTPLKRLVFDMEEVHSASPDYKMTFYRQSRVWDYLLSDNRFSTDVFESAFLFPREQILELGYPRNDILYCEDKEERVGKLKKELGIPADKKIILYAPTWRDDEYYAPGKYKFRLPLDLALLKENLSKDYVLLLRTHYFIADHMEIREEEKDFVRDVSRYNDVGELYLLSDILITDYSSVFFDYANLRRPMLFYVYDFEKYRDTLRGFYIDMEAELPGPLLYTNDQVLEAIQNIDSVTAEYASRYDSFAERFCGLDDGHAAARIVDEVFR